MGVKLVDQHIAAPGVQLSTLIARHHPGRYPRRTQDKGHGAGVVGTESPTAVEQEFISAVPPQARWSKGVVEGFDIEVAQQRLHQIGIVWILPPQLGSKGP